MAKGQLYPADDEKPHFVRHSKRPKVTKLRKSITPGTVLILLTGRFKGRRVVFLKQLPSGLLLVTGPYKINGVPLKRVNQAYVIPTSTKVDLAEVSLDALHDKDFERPKSKEMKRKSAKPADLFVQKTGATPADQDRLAEKKKRQVELDKPIVAALAKVEMLGSYLKTRFTVRKNTLPHELRF